MFDLFYGAARNSVPVETIDAEVVKTNLMEKHTISKQLFSESYWQYSIVD